MNENSCDLCIHVYICELRDSIRKIVDFIESGQGMELMAKLQKLIGAECMLYKPKEVNKMDELKQSVQKLMNIIANKVTPKKELSDSEMAAIIYLEKYIAE